MRLLVEKFRSSGRLQYVRIPFLRRCLSCKKKADLLYRADPTKSWAFHLNMLPTCPRDLDLPEKSVIELRLGHRGRDFSFAIPQSRTVTWDLPLEKIEILERSWVPAIDFDRRFLDDDTQLEDVVRELKTKLPGLRTFEVTTLSEEESVSLPSEDRLATATPVVVLFLGANPSDSTRLALTREVQAIDDLVRSAEHRDLFRIEQQWESHAKRVAPKILRFRPGIVHFSGHGSETGELVFQDQEGKSSPATKATIAEVFRLVGKDVRCVVLNACFSLEQAELIAEHIDTVIGMSDAVGDSAAITFAAAFYEALAYGQDVETAFELGKTSIDLDRFEDKDVPKLLVQDGVNASTVRFVT